jgi:hypothetical protein
VSALELQRNIQTILSFLEERQRDNPKKPLSNEWFFVQVSIGLGS